MNTIAWPSFLIDLQQRMTPELLAAVLLIIASMCFFAAALTLVLTLRAHLASTAVAPGAPISAHPVRRNGNAAGLMTASMMTGEDARQPGAAPPAGTREGADGAFGVVGGRETRDFAREISLARQGSDARKLMRECGLSRMEANLVVRMYGDPDKVNAGPTPSLPGHNLSGPSAA